MAALNNRVKARCLDAIRVLSELGTVQGAWVFGSQVEGHPDAWSDIDIAVFMEGMESWDIRRRARAMALVQKEVSTEVEVHLFPATATDNPPAGSFADYVIRHGVRCK